MSAQDRDQKLADTSRFHSEKAIELYEHHFDNLDAPATAGEKAWKQILLGAARDTLQAARALKVDEVRTLLRTSTTLE